MLNNFNFTLSLNVACDFVEKLSSHCPKDIIQLSISIIYLPLIWFFVQGMSLLDLIMQVKKYGNRFDIAFCIRKYVHKAYTAHESWMYGPLKRPPFS